jgi:hypothetical protein
MGHDARLVGNQLGAELAHGAVGGEVSLKIASASRLQVFGFLHAIERPEQVHRGRPAFARTSNDWESH